VLFHSTSRFSLKTRMSSTRSYWENLYHLLCAFSFYFSIFFENTHELNSLLLRKPLSFTMCFLILFLDFLWKHAWTQLALTEKTFIIYYVLSHSISRFSLKTRMSSTRSYWENLYHLLCAFSFYFLMNALRKPLSFTMCFLIEFILFLDERIIIEKISIIYYVLIHSILRRARFSLKTWLQTQLALTEKISIIYYVLSHRVHSISQRAHCHWENLYYLMSAFSLNQIIEKISIIYYVLFHSILRRASWEHLYYLLCAFSSNRVLRRAHCHWKNLYYLVSASSVIYVQDLTSTLIMIDVKSFLETLRKSLLFSRCFLIIFLNERIEKTSII